MSCECSLSGHLDPGQGQGKLDPVKGDLLSVVVRFPFQRVDLVMLHFILFRFYFLFCALLMRQLIRSHAYRHEVDI